MTLQNIKSSEIASSSKGFLVIHTSYSPYATFGGKWLEKILLFMKNSEKKNCTKTAKNAITASISG